MSAFATTKLARRVYTKEQLQTALKCHVACADTDHQYYRYNDLRWLVKPTRKCMAGILGPKQGAVPAHELVALEVPRR